MYDKTREDQKFSGSAEAAPTLIPILTLAIGADIVSYTGGYHNRQQVSGYTSP
jgi:hypothetical protein